MDVATPPLAARHVADRYATSSVLWQAVAPQAPGDESLVAQVYELLWKQIVEGERQQGERIIDAELVEELQISRTPIRHALYQLQQAGLIEASTGRGFHVVVLKEQDVRDLYELRVILEVASIRAAALQVPELALRAALDEIAVMRRLSEPDLSPRFLRSDIHMHHELIAGNSGNRQLAELVATKRAQMSIFLVGGTRLPGGVMAAIDEHEQILHALLERDVDAAARAMEHHIQRVKDDALVYMANQRSPRIHRLRSPGG